MENNTYFNPSKKPSFNFLKKKKTDEVNNLDIDGDASMKSTKVYTPGSKKPKNGKLIKTLGAGSGVLLLLGGVVALLGFMFVVKPAYAVYDVINDLSKDSAALNEALLSRNMVEFGEILDKTERDLQRVGEARDANFKWAKKAKFTKDYYTDTDRFIAAGQHAVNAGREFAVLVTPFADAAGLTVIEDESTPRGHTGLAEAFSSWIGIMPEVAANMDNIISELAGIGDELENIDANKYPEDLMGQPVRSLIRNAQGSLSNIDEFGPDLKKALEMIPVMLGVNTPEQRYAIIMQNDKEIRGTGGFWTNYATFKVNNALLTSDFTSKDMYSIDFLLEQIDAYHTFPTVPAKYAQYLKVERMFARDANISPDFPTAIEQWN